MNEISQLLNVTFPSIISVQIESVQGFETIDFDGISHSCSGYPCSGRSPSYYESYSGIVRHSLDTVNVSQNHAASKMTAVAQGQSDDLTGAVMAIQRASLSFQILLQTRNRFVEGYHETFNQQI